MKINSNKNIFFSSTSNLQSSENAESETHSPSANANPLQGRVNQLDIPMRNLSGKEKALLFLSIAAAVVGFSAISYFISQTSSPPRTSLGLGIMGGNFFAQKQSDSSKKRKSNPNIEKHVEEKNHNNMQEKQVKNSLPAPAISKQKENGKNQRTFQKKRNFLPVFPLPSFLKSFSKKERGEIDYVKKPLFTQKPPTWTESWKTRHEKLKCPKIIQEEKFPITENHESRQLSLEKKKNLPEKTGAKYREIMGAKIEMNKLILNGILNFTAKYENFMEASERFEELYNLLPSEEQKPFNDAKNKINERKKEIIYEVKNKLNELKTTFEKNASKIPHFSKFHTDFLKNYNLLSTEEQKPFQEIKKAMRNFKAVKWGLNEAQHSNGDIEKNIEHTIDKVTHKRSKTVSTLKRTEYTAANPNPE